MPWVATPSWRSTTRALPAAAPAGRSSTRRAGGVAGADQAHLGVLQRADLGQQVADRLLGLAAAVLDVLAGALVGDDEDHVAQGVALLLDDGGVGQRQQQHREGAQAPQHAARAAPEGQRDQQRRGDPQPADQPQRQHRGPLDGKRAHGAASNKGGIHFIVPAAPR
jgi:hypothetical protein